MNLLVCGGAGFIGSEFVRTVLKSQPTKKIVVVDALTYAGNLSTIKDFEKHITFVRGFIQDPIVIDRVLTDHKITHVVNFAAETHNDRSILDSGRFIYSNVLGPYTLLEGCKKHGIERMVHVSTDEVYGSIQTGSFTEASPIAPNTPYSASKAGGDLQCLSHFKTFGTPVIVTRGGNTYGPFQYPEKLIPLSIVRLLSGKKVPVYGKGNQRREWIHVEDHAMGILVALLKGTPGEVYNVGDTNERTNLQILKTILKTIGANEASLVSVGDPRKGAHDFRYSLCSGKLQSLGWAPTVKLDIGLGKTVEWYLLNENWWRPIVESISYIEFMKRFYGPLLGKNLL